MKEIIVTGATSFIGRPCVERLLREGYRVYAVVRPDSAGRAELERRAQKEEGLTVLLCALAEVAALSDRSRFPQLRREENGPVAWLHLGWEGAGSANRANPALQAKNVGYALEALRTAAALGCRRFLFTGSQAEYGIRESRMREEDPCVPVSEYGKCKCLVRVQAEEEAKTLGIEYLHARIFSVYGPGDHPWSLIETCIDTFTKDGHMKMGPCSQLWNFLYIEDTAELLVKLLVGKAPSGVYNVAGDDTRPLRDYIEELYELCGCRGSYEFGNRPPNAEGQIALIPDIEKLMKATGFPRLVSFREGIGEILRRRGLLEEAVCAEKGECK